jgi:NAD(P)-dependent dehydrogenase (short-subunit alcohol dehydrogenase family)
MAGSEVELSRVALITGGSQGLGEALAARLAGEGWRLVLDARRTDRLAAVVAALGPNVVGLDGDITEARHRADLVDAVAGLGGVDLVVNNASTLGASPLPKLDEVEPGVLRRIFDVNVVAPLALVRELGAQLRAGATVVNITSDAAVEPYEGWGGYGASKAALEQASRVLAAERPDLRVLVVDPGDMRTEMHQDAFPGEDISDRPPPDGAADGIVALVASAATSGRYAAQDLPAELVSR